MIYMPMPEGKVCSRCGEWKPFDQLTKNKHHTYGVRACCKACLNSYVREWRAGNSDKTKEYRRKAYEADPQKHRDRVRLERQADPRKAQERDKRQSEKHHEKRIQRSREWYSKNPDVGREASRNWRRSNPAKYKAQKLKRRARERSLPDAFTPEDWLRCLDYFGYRCAYCGKRGAVLTGDHYVPLADLRSDNPGTVPTNIVPACRSCNCSKGDSDPVEWLTHKFDPEQAQAALDRVNAYFELIRQQDNQCQSSEGGE